MPGSNRGLRADAGSSFSGPLCPGHPWRIPIPWGNCTSICVTYPECPWLCPPDPVGRSRPSRIRDVLAQAQPHAGAVEALWALEGSNPSPPTWAAEQDLPPTETPPD